MAKPALKVESVAISSLSLHPRNPRKGNIEVIADSLAIHEQYKPIVAQKSTGHVLAGNHTLQAAEALGWDEIQVVFVDVDDDEATRILLADNRTSDLGEYDNELLVELLEGLPELDGTGYSADDLDVMAADLELPDIVPAARQSVGTGKRVLAETVEWGYIGWGKATKLTITAAEVDALDRALEAHKQKHGTETGFVFWAVQEFAEKPLDTDEDDVVADVSDEHQDEADAVTAGE